MNHHIDVQNACHTPLPFTEQQLKIWALTALTSVIKPSELTLRFVDAEEMQTLNHQYRHQNKTTNVLSFPARLPEHVILDIAFIGDVIICPQVLLQEAAQNHQPLINHWAHIIIHGILHLLGYDHIKPEDECIMQQLEIDLLQQLGFDNPYLTKEDERA